MSVICWAALAATAHAQEMSFTFDETAAQQGVDTAAVEAELQGAIGGALKLNRPEEWMAQMAAANALAAQGMGVDYATNPQKFVFGGSFGSAVNGAGARLGMGGAELPEAGYAVQAAVMAGLNLGAFAEEDRFARRVVVSVHGMLAGGETGAFMADFYSVGGHLQVKAVRPRQGALWSGAGSI